MDKAELICKLATNGNSITIDRTVLVEDFIARNGRWFADEVITFRYVGENKDRVRFCLNTNKMSNAQIRYYNLTYDLNIPDNEDVELYDEIDRTEWYNPKEALWI